MKEYRPDGPVLAEYMRSQAPVKIIQGPIGSGKSLASAMCIWMKALEQVKQKGGVRKCRAHVFRDRYPALEETTLKTWLDWFPEKEFGRFYWSKPYLHEIRLGDVYLDVHFVALEDERSADFFKSLETTIVWFNEVQYMDRLLVDEAVTRVGRYPRVIDGGAVNPQVIADMNAPSEMHWIPMMRGDVAIPEDFTLEKRNALKKPADWEFFIQPPGLVEVKDDSGVVEEYRENREAENTAYLAKGYYLNAIKGKTKSWIDANVLNRVSPRREGKPVLASFRRDVHVAKRPLEPIGDLPLILGADFGRRPTVTFWQHLRLRWFCIHEFAALDMGSAQFAPMLRNELAQRFPGRKFTIWGDPSGDFKGQNDDKTPYQIFRANGLPIQPAPSNLFTVRLQALEQVLTRMVDGEPGLLISPTCTNLIAAFDGGYHFRRMAMSGERYSEMPEKDNYSDFADSAQYAILGGGEGRMLLTGSAEKPKPKKLKNDGYNPLKKVGGVRRW